MLPFRQTTEEELRKIILEKFAKAKKAEYRRTNQKKEEKSTKEMFADVVLFSEAHHDALKALLTLKNLPIVWEKSSCFRISFTKEQEVVLASLMDDNRVKAVDRVLPVNHF